jgi:hypothetical protein
MIHAEGLASLVELPPCEHLGRHVITPGSPLILGELRLSFDEVFTPERVGWDEGTRDLTLLGVLLPAHEIEGPRVGINCARSGIFADHVHENRLGRYRWTVTAVTPHEGHLRVELLVDRLASPRAVASSDLAPGESRSFWLSTRGASGVEFERPNGIACFSYQDYVQVELGVYPGHEDESDRWSARLRARRVVQGYQTLHAEVDLLPLPAAPLAFSLGDHRVELLALAPAPGTQRLPEGLIGAPRPELSVQIRLTRGLTIEGLLPSPPPVPAMTTAGRPLPVDGAPRLATVRRGRWGA